MSETVADIISDAEVDKVHAYANFGDMSKRDVIADGVLKAAVGYQSGHTQLCILMEHRLIRRPRPGSYDMVLNKKGRRYLRAAIGGNFHKLLPLTQSAETNV